MNVTNQEVPTLPLLLHRWINNERGSFSNVRYASNKTIVVSNKSIDSKKGMYTWLEEVLNCNNNQFTAEYMRTNRRTIVEDYEAVYNRYS